MTTERELRERQAKRRKSSAKAPSSRKAPRKQSNVNASGFLLFFGLIGLGASFTLHQPNLLSRSQISRPTTQTISPPPPQSVTVGATTRPAPNITAIDSQAQSLNYSGTSITELAALLAAQAPTEAEKARIIYSWLAYHITYDVPAYESGNYGDVSPESVLRNRTTVCSGYANLYAALAQAMGLEAEVIIGYGKGASYLVGNQDNKPNHAWNVVKIDGGWYLLDATWGAGTVNNGTFNPQFNPHYFATPPDQFIYDHYPEEAVWQLLPNAYSKAQFDEMPKVFAAFFQNQLELISHRQLHIQANQQVQIQLAAPPTTLATAQLRSQDQELPGNYTFVQQRNGQIIVNASFPAPGSYELRIFAKDHQKDGLYPLVVSYQVQASQAGEQFPETYQSFVEHDAYLDSPQIRTLPPQQSTSFSLTVPDAEEVQILDQGTGKWTELTRYGDQFAGSVEVSGNKLLVLAKFPGSDQYMSLLGYN